MKEYEFKEHERSSVGGNPMLPGYRVNLGKDNNGKEWLCEIAPTGQLSHLLWNVDFDTTDEFWTAKVPNSDSEDSEDYSSPFLRPEVVYCDACKWREMHRLWYHRKMVEYHNIKKAIDEFVEERGIK